MLAFSHIEADMNTNELTVGRHIEHTEHGAGTVTLVGPDYIGIRFDNQLEALIRREVIEQDAPALVEPKAKATVLPDLP